MKLKLLEIFTKVVHGGPIDGAKTVIGVGAYLASKAIAAKHPELAGPLEEVGQFFMIWGLGSNAVKGATPAPSETTTSETTLSVSPSSSLQVQSLIQSEASGPKEQLLQERLSQAQKRAFLPPEKE